MQSGISASQELVSQFNDLLASDAHFGLLATIQSEALVPLNLLAPVSPSASFADNLSALAPHLSPTEALYIILRRHDTAPKLIAVTYVPDAAKVRQKMLFAATRLTLTRELGNEHFRETLFVTDAAELSPAGFDKHDAHVKLDAPLTEEEQSLGAVKRAEQEAGAGTGVKEIHLSGHMKMPVHEDAVAALKALNGGDRVLATLKINQDSENVELVPSSDAPSSIADLVQTISTTEPRFTFYRYDHTHGGESSSPILFFYTYPAVPGKKAIRNRMLYPLMKRAVLTVAETEAGLTIAAKFDAEDPSEITEQTVTDELHPRVETRQAFSRPKRPGRR